MEPQVNLRCFLIHSTTKLRAKAICGNRETREHIVANWLETNNLMEWRRDLVTQNSLQRVLVGGGSRVLDKRGNLSLGSAAH